MKKSELIKIIKEEVVNVLSEMPLITKKGKVAYADGKPLKMSNIDALSNNISMYHEKEGNFLIPKGKVMLWFADNENYRNKLISGEYDMVIFPIRTLYNSFSVSPINDVWKMSKARGKKEVLGIINAQLTKNDELLIQMMSVRGSWRNNRINSFMIDVLKLKFPNKILAFENPTEDGLAFIEKYAPHARVYQNGKVL